jgi:hypothetical protein
MLPVPFLPGNKAYDTIFIVSYVAWILFEVVTGKSRKTLDRRRRGIAGRSSFWWG